MTLLKRAFVFALALCPGAPAWAQTNMPAQNEPLAWPESSFDAGAALLRALLSLLFVIALIAACGWFIRRRGVGALGSRGSGPIQVLASRRLEADKQIHLVQIGARHLVLATSPSGVEVLCELSSEEASTLRSDDLEASVAQTHLSKVQT